MTDGDDWLELWSRFDFANGNEPGATRPQLELAMQTADTSLDIDRAVDEGVLRAQTETDAHGIEWPTRYRLNLAGGMA